ncbi:hypothetical protein LPJ57_007434 [Coemansia sp. RSA 486]|nr:hypothetical protein LPJ57_007434 [Coemansia sp. RSA 486]
MENKMVGVALQSVIEAIDNRDYSRLEDICTPQISKMYKYALSHLDAQKHRIRVSMVSSGTPWIDGFMLKSGPPEAFNTEVPFPKRYEQFKYKFQNTARIAALRKQMDEKELRVFNPLYNEDGDSRMSIDVWCKVPVSVKIELSRNGKVIDSDQGEMTIPLTFSSPAYENPFDLTRAVLKLEGAEDLEPFRWSISDIFFIIDLNEARDIHRCYFGKKVNGQSGTQE